MGLDRSPDQLIRVGRAALKQKDYRRAIAAFQMLCQLDDISKSYYFKAQMGLILAYEAQGAHTQAQNLCKSLLNSHSQSIRQWANDKLQQLLSDVEKPSTKSSSHTSDTTQADGFIPENSGFIPFNKRETIDTPQSPTTTPSIDITAPYLKDGDSDNNLSLFHYQTLNNKHNLNREDRRIAESTHGNNKANGTTYPQFNRSLTNPNTPSPTHLNKHPLKPQRDNNSQQSTADAVIVSTKASTEPDTWPQGERLSTLKFLNQVNNGRLWFAQLITILIFFLVVRGLVDTSLTWLRNYLQFLDQLLPLNIHLAAFFSGNHTWTVIAAFILLTLATPWLWPLLLPHSKHFTRKQLQTHSLEADQLLRRFCSKHLWTIPEIHIIANDLPIIFSYGWYPRFGHIVISQGLLTCLDADELAAIILYEMSHWSTIDWVFFSGHGLLLQACHRSYWGLAQWGETQPSFIKTTAGTLATLSYGVFWLLTKVGYGLARTRVPYRDRSAAELTGNPNGLIRALAKISIAMEKGVALQGYTPPLLESLALMLPVGPSNIASIQHLAWGAFNPLRHWLSINQSHPPLGDRLYILSAYARHWHLRPSLNFAQLELKNDSRTMIIRDWQNLILQGGAWSGLVLGLGIALIMWLVGAIATSQDFPLLAWLYRDRSILLGVPLISAATIQILRTNRFFPEIKASLPNNEPQLNNGQINPTLIPLKSLPLKINGTLTGRPNLANWLGQEWRLHTSYGSIRLHHITYLGPISHPNGLTPQQIINQPIQATGWLRRGGTLWIDMEQFHTKTNQIVYSQHPTWALLTSLTLLAWGLWIIFRGG